MGMHWPGFFVRLGSALVFCTVMLLGLTTRDWAFFLLILLIQGLCLREYFQLVSHFLPQNPRKKETEGGLQWGAFLVLLLAYFWPGLSFPLLGAGFSLLLLAGALVPRLPFPWTAWLPLPWGYIVLPMICALGLYGLDSSLPLALVLIIWTNDTMAYLCGSFFGRTPMTSISPKKTWEGTLGGGLLSLVAALLLSLIWPSWDLLPLLGFTALVVVTGTLGDLLESRLKREAGVKDSGQILPGHGGALDRFDSLLAALPPAYAYAWIWMGA